MQNPKLNAIVIQSEEISPWQMILRVKTDGWDLPGFEPGQFAVLGLPGSSSRCTLSEPEILEPDPNLLIRRAFSIASSCLNQDYLEFFITLVTDGALTPRLFNLKNGDRIYLSQRITGLFTLDKVPPEMNVVFMATGTGLAPYVSMLKTHFVCNSNQRFVVLHGARHSLDLGYRSELIALEQQCDNFVYLPVISRPQEEKVPWLGLTGYIQDLWKNGFSEETWGFKPTPDNTHIFLCGNPSMIETMLSYLEKQSYREDSKKIPGEIHVERYW